MEAVKSSFSNLQIELLKVFSRNVSDEDVLEIRRLVARYFADKATSLADKIWDEKGWTNEDAERMLHEHMRTPYDRQPEMKYIEDPDIDLVVNPKHLSEEEAEEITAFILP